MEVTVMVSVALGGIIRVVEECEVAVGDITMEFTNKRMKNM